MGEQKYHGLLDTGASNSLVAERLVEQGQTQMGEIFGVKVGNGAVQLTSGETEGVVHVGEEDIPFSFATFDTDAFDEAGSDPRGHLGVTWGVYLCAGKPPLADIILSHPPDLT